MFAARREQLVNKLKRQGYIKTSEVEKAFIETPREEFVPSKLKEHAYFDTPLEIGEGQTISAPHMVAIMVEALNIEKGQKFLEIGTGSGYHAAIVSKLVGKEGHVYTVERISSLANIAKKNIDEAAILNITVEEADGSLGLEKYSPYDCIYVTCAAPFVLNHLLKQLMNKGKLLVPVGKQVCDLILIEKTNEKIIKKNLGGCAFVPLIGKYGH